MVRPGGASGPHRRVCSAGCQTRLVTTTATVRLSEAQWQLLLDARSAYRKAVSIHYDEVLHEVSARAISSGSIGKADIGALLVWKRLRADTPWASQLNVMADADVRVHTARAMKRVNDASLSLSDAAGAGRGALAQLPGFVSGDALASALLLAMAPTRMAVYDRRADAALRALDVQLSSSPGRYRRFMQIVDDLVQARPDAAPSWIPRDVDIALFQLGERR